MLEVGTADPFISFRKYEQSFAVAKELRRLSTSKSNAEMVISKHWPSKVEKAWGTSFWVQSLCGSF
ncbi:MAG: hypothetical protein ACTS68_00290 [Candidatus Hodgkinia cicadicola]